MFGINLAPFRNMYWSRIAEVIRRLGTGPVLLFTLLMSGYLPTHAEAQPVTTSPVTPPSSAASLASATPRDPAAGTDEFAQLRAELAGLAATNTEATDQAISAWLDRLLAGQVPKGIWLEVLDAAAKHGSAEIQQKLRQYRAARLAEGGLNTYAEVLYGGNPVAGRKIFFEKKETTCSKCHNVGGEGGTNGPPLDGVATNLTRELILESIIYPNAKITPGYESARVVLKDRRGYNGLIKHETETELTLDCPPDGDVTIKKSDIATRAVGSSPMPDGFGSILSGRELRDLIEFLAEPKPNKPALAAGRNDIAKPTGK